MSKADMDIMNMSDEELMKLGPSAFMASSEEENQEKEDQDQEEEVGADQAESEGSGDEGAEDPNDEVTLWITEVWDSQDSHKASLALPAVQAAIARGRPLIAGFGQRVETRPIDAPALGLAPVA